MQDTSSTNEWKELSTNSKSNHFLYVSKVESNKLPKTSISTRPKGTERVILIGHGRRQEVIWLKHANI